MIVFIIVGLVQLFGIYTVVGQLINWISRLVCHNNISSVHVHWLAAGVVLTVFRYVFGI